jgi:CRP-like cAMP-binding protein
VLLLKVQQIDESFEVFSNHDINILSHTLSILSFEADETIIHYNEPASFCAIVLSGTLNAYVSPTLTVPLKEGALVGEMES